MICRALEALKRVTGDLKDVIRIAREDKRVRGEWPRAEQGLEEAQYVIDTHQGCDYTAGYEAGYQDGCEAQREPAGRGTT